MKINWTNGTGVRSKPYFNDLELGETFAVDTVKSRGAVYIKVCLQGLHGEYHFGQLDLVTMKVFPPTTNPVRRVSVEINVDAPKPMV